MMGRTIKLPPQSGLGDGYHVYPNGARLRLSCSRKVLARKLSITLETEFCLEALEEALARYASSRSHRSGLPIPQHRLHRPAAQERDQDQHGWERRLARQRLRRAPVAD